MSVPCSLVLRSIDVINSVPHGYGIKFDKQQDGLSLFLMLNVPVKSYGHVSLPNYVFIFGKLD